MLFDMLILFILVTIICLILSIFLMEDKPLLAIPMIMMGMIFSILCTYGMFDVELYTNSFNSSSGLTELEITHFMEWGDPYAYVFMLMFFVFMILFIRAGFNMWRIALETQSEINYKMR
jgi:hypothetical protein